MSKTNYLYEQAAKLIESAQSLVIIQADNPDADSLGSALAIEQIMTDLGKYTRLYCGVDMPGYLHFMSGWSRVEKELPNDFDLAILVDVSTVNLLDKITTDKNYNQYKKSKHLVLDHHKSVSDEIDADVLINLPELSSTGELIFNLAIHNGWALSPTAGESILHSILGDTQGLTNKGASPETYRVVAQLLDNGIDRVEIEEKRREFNKMTESIFRYKSELIKRTQLFSDNRIAVVSIPQDEINEYSPLYNPAALIQPDTLQVENVVISIVFKSYVDGKITAAIRSSAKAPISSMLAEQFGGGGHDNASGFKISQGANLPDTVKACVHKATKLLDDLG